MNHGELLKCASFLGGLFGGGDGKPTRPSNRWWADSILPNPDMDAKTPVEATMADPWKTALLAGSAAGLAGAVTGGYFNKNYESGIDDMGAAAVGGVLTGIPAAVAAGMWQKSRNEKARMASRFAPGISVEQARQMEMSPEEIFKQELENRQIP